MFETVNEVGDGTVNKENNIWLTRETSFPLLLVKYKHNGNT